MREANASSGATDQTDRMPPARSDWRAEASPRGLYSASLPVRVSPSGPLSTSRRMASHEAVCQKRDRDVGPPTIVTRRSSRQPANTSANGPRAHRTTAGTSSATTTCASGPMCGQRCTEREAHAESADEELRPRMIFEAPTGLDRERPPPSRSGASSSARCAQGRSRKPHPAASGEGSPRRLGQATCRRGSRGSRAGRCHGAIARSRPREARDRRFSLRRRARCAWQDALLHRHALRRDCAAGRRPYPWRRPYGTRSSAPARRRPWR